MKVKLVISVTGADPGIFIGGGGGGGGGWANFGSQRTVVSWSLLAREILLCEQRRTDHRRVPKNNYIFEYGLNLAQWQNATRVLLNTILSM